MRERRALPLPPSPRENAGVQRLRRHLALRGICPPNGAESPPPPPSCSILRRGLGFRVLSRHARAQGRIGRETSDLHLHTCPFLLWFTPPSGKHFLPRTPGRPINVITLNASATKQDRGCRRGSRGGGRGWLDGTWTFRCFFKLSLTSGKYVGRVKNKVFISEEEGHPPEQECGPPSFTRTALIGAGGVDVRGPLSSAAICDKQTPLLEKTEQHPQPAAAPAAKATPAFCCERSLTSATLRASGVGIGSGFFVLCFFIRLILTFIFQTVSGTP